MGNIVEGITAVLHDVITLFSQASPSVWMMFGLIAFVSVILPIIIAFIVILYLRKGPGKAIVLFINHFGNKSFDNAKESYSKTVDDLKLLEKSI